MKRKFLTIAALLSILPSLAAPAHAGFLDVLDGMVKGIPLVGDVYKATAAGYVDKQLNPGDYMTIPANFVQFKIDVSTAFDGAVKEYAGSEVLGPLATDSQMRNVTQAKLTGRRFNGTGLLIGIGDGVIIAQETKSDAMGYFYDTVTGVLVNPKGFYRVTDRKTIDLLKSLAAQPERWKEYVKTGSCSIENTINLGTGRKSLFTKDAKCTDALETLTRTAAELFEESLDLSGVQKLTTKFIDTKTVTGEILVKTIQKYPVDETLKSESRILADMHRFRSPKLQAEIASLLAVLPPESELIQTIRWSASRQEATGQKRAGIGMWEQINVDAYRTIKYDAEAPSWIHPGSLKSVSYAEYLGWLAWINDDITNTLKRLPLEPDKNVFSPKHKWVAGRVDYPILDLSVVAAYNKMLVSLTPDEIRKLVILAGNGKYRTDPIKGDALRFATGTWGFLSRDSSETTAATLPHSMGFLAVSAQGGQYPNDPTTWADHQGFPWAPGFTADKLMSFAFTGRTAEQTLAMQMFVALSHGSDAGRKFLNSAISNAQVAAVKKIARDRIRPAAEALAILFDEDREPSRAVPGQRFMWFQSPVREHQLMVSDMISRIPALGQRVVPSQRPVYVGKSDRGINRGTATKSFNKKTVEPLGVKL